MNMLAGDEFISSPPKKTVRFGGTLTDILLKYERVSARHGAGALRPRGRRIPVRARADLPLPRRRLWAGARWLCCASGNFASPGLCGAAGKRMSVGSCSASGMCSAADASRALPLVFFAL